MITPQNIQITDLLLGINQPQNGNKSAMGAVDGLLKGLVFDDILGMFENPLMESSENELLENETGDNLLEELHGNNVELPFPEKSKLSQSGIARTQFAELSEEMPISKDIDALIARVIDDNKANTKVNANFELNTVHNANLKDLLSRVPMNATSGKFEVLDAQVVGNRFELEVASKTADSSGETIKISLPLSSLSQLEKQPLMVGTKTNGKENRVSLVSQLTGASSKEGMEDLLVKLNLKSIEIDFEMEKKTSETLMNNDKAVIKLSSTRVDVPVPTFELPRREIRVSRQIENSELKGKSLQEDYQSGKMIIDKAQVTINNQGNARADMNSGQPRQLFDLFQAPSDSKILGFDNNASMNQITATNMISDVVENMAGAEKSKTLYSPVRVNIPDSSLKALQPNGKSVSIRIEPENIGPARLSLTLNNQTLSARIAVDSVQAKAVIENSLEQLTNQLNRAGIKVEVIEVMIAGGSAQEQLPERRPNWRQFNKSQKQFNIDEEDTEGIVRKIELVAINATIVQSNGAINLLA